MADTTDFLLKLYEEDWNQARQAEDQRSVITNLVMIIASILIGLISQTGLNIQVIPMTISLFVLGVYGTITSQKLYERHRYFSDRASLWRSQISKLLPDAQVDTIKSLATKEHSKRFKHIERLRLSSLWLTLHISIALSGIILTILGVT